MKEHSIAISVSLLFHIVIVALFLRVPFDQYIKPKIMVLDFSLERGRVAGEAKGRKMEDGNRESARFNPAEGGKIVNRESKIEDRELLNRGQTTDYRNRTIEQAHNVQREGAELSGGLNAVASDPAGQVAVRGEVGPTGAKAGSVSEKYTSVGEDSRKVHAVSGSIRVIDDGKSGSAAKDFPFVADTINKRFKDKYPDRARRMGWEGKVFLNFVISENGAVHEVEIVNGSGRQIFDDHAREILKKTTFNEKLFYPLKIENWCITYKLQ
jgi:TonB family protein